MADTEEDAMKLDSTLDDACRLCLDTKQTRSSIFDGLADAGVPFAEKIRTHLSIQVTSEDKVSTLVCSACVKSVNQWHSFKDICLKSQEKLQQWVKKKEAVTKSATMDEAESTQAKTLIDPQVEVNKSNDALQKTNEDNEMDVDTETSTTSVPTEGDSTLLSQTSVSNAALNSENDSTVQVKDEPIDSEEEYDFNVDVESVASGEPGELLPNPMAVRTATAAPSERIVEADSTQKSIKKTTKVKKKARRGPKTHFRGLKSFKKKCITCNKNLHSKWSYQQHMAKYHTYENGISENAEQSIDEPPPDQPMEQTVNQPSPGRRTGKIASEPPLDQPLGIDSEAEEFSPNRQRTRITPYVFDVFDGTVTCYPDEKIYAEMIQTEPLTPLQRVLIGQLKTFSCFQCKHSYSNRKMTLNHIKLHMPELKNFTCLACFSEFTDRSTYKRHCAASFECAMKIALVVPRKGLEKYFTCNMCLKPCGDRKHVLEHIADHSSKRALQTECAPTESPKLIPLKSPTRQSSRPTDRSRLRSPPKLTPIKSIPFATPPPLEPKTFSPLKGKSFSVFNGPYQNGDPAHNFACDLCGMIYRYRPNLLKHREFCETLPLHDRTSYRCIHCNMTYLIYKKFLSHVFSEHKKHEITCFTCQSKFLSSEDYFNHHESHRIIMNKDSPEEDIKESKEYKIQPEFNHIDGPSPLKASADLMARLEKPFKCALCSEMFATKAELSEHRNLHLKVKIYSCVVCRSMFSSSVALEQHMKMHGLDNADSSGQNAVNKSCIELGNATHSQSLLNNSALSTTSEPGPPAHDLKCYQCDRVFSNLPNLKRHQKNLHFNKDKRRLNCNKCNRRFKTENAYQEHLRIGHGVTEPPPIPKTPAPKTVPRYDDRPLLKCPKCPKTFTYQGNLILHCQNVHKENHFERAILNASRQTTSTPIPSAAIAPTVISPPLTSPQDYTCDVCGKKFNEVQSLRVHRGWHFRSSNKLKTEVSSDDFETHDEEMPMAEEENSAIVEDRGYTMVSTPSIAVDTPPVPKPAKARKSFPNNPHKQQLNVLAASSGIGSLQCQVCDDRFSDVTELRKHLWDVHCARNKPDREEAIHEEEVRPRPQLQARKQYLCGLCPSKFGDQDSLSAHSRWHEHNLITTSNGPSSQSAAVDEIRSVSEGNSNQSTGVFHCETCGKNYTNRKVFYRHKKLHKVMPGTTFSFQSLQVRQSHYCKVCRKNFATEASLRRHKRSEIHAIVVKEQAEVAAAPQRITTTAMVHYPPPEQQKQQQPHSVRQAPTPMPSLVVKKEPIWDSESYHEEPPEPPRPSYTAAPILHQVRPESFKKKAFKCQICQTLFPNMSVLYQHKQLVHKMPPINKKKTQPVKCVPLVNAAGMVCCNLCGKQFPGIPNLKQHFTIKHKNAVNTVVEPYPCTAEDCNLVFSTAAALKAHEATHSNIIFTCHLCDRHVFSRGAMTKHQLTAHHAVYMSGVNRASLWSEFDLNAYSVRNCQGTECLSCKIKYPNLRALKIHFIKIHDRI
ncbi:hypothetical protein QAD02_015795 [Eretmocerus hayati]|uniref:Uncharacterized protein n=1 Tax=Eretmocerus hayati TaxID=131215 RepID=A0ACC2PAA7_9HYME|nr:hypothetical protein QAD02_015795 [Eretmocerus hayati]